MGLKFKMMKYPPDYIIEDKKRMLAYWKNQIYLYKIHLKYAKRQVKTITKELKNWEVI